MTTKHKSEDYKINAVEYYLNGNKTQENVCDIFKKILNINYFNFDNLSI
jgi:hypothetical protein